MDSRNQPRDSSSGSLLQRDSDDEDVEYDCSDEHDLFLHEDYVKPANNFLLPYRAISPASQVSNHSFSRNQRDSSDVEITESSEEQAKFEPLVLVEPGNIAISSRSVVYQSPNYNRFAGELGPSSGSGILVSLILIVVILCVTLLPVIVPHLSPLLIHNKNAKENVIRPSHSHDSLELPDARCKCICSIPLVTSEIASNSTKLKLPTAKRSLYVGSSQPEQCNCANIVRPHLNLTLVNLKQFCVRCECRYQSRNLSTIKRNVIFFLTVLISLTSYMFVQYLLKYLRITRRSLPSYMQWLVYQMNDG